MGLLDDPDGSRLLQDRRYLGAEGILDDISFIVVLLETILTMWRRVHPTLCIMTFNSIL